VAATTPQKESSPRPRRAAAETREHILTVAGELFYREGIRATGVDTVAARAKVAPPTLYRLFRTKDDLVAAYVDRCSAAYKDRLTSATQPSAGEPRERLLAVFDVFAADALVDTCRGCPFLLVIAEFPDPASPAHRAAVAHKAWVRDLLRQLVGELATHSPIDDVAALADQLALIAEGVYGSVQALGPTGPAKSGRSCADALIDAAISGAQAPTAGGKV
jgi:AcrR family transcriptional regulator